MTEKVLYPYFKSIIDMDQCAVVVCNLVHEIIYMNPAAAERYAKWGGEALLGRSLLDCHSPGSGEMIQKVVDWFAQDKEHDRIYHLHLPQRQGEQGCLYGSPAGRGRQPDRLL